MNSKLVATSLLALVLALAGACVAEEDPIDQELLVEYRAAVPTLSDLEAPQPMPTTMTAMGDPALYPNVSWPIVQGINGSVSNLITVLEMIVATPPTLYNSETAEFVWGPWPNDDGVGYVAAYIKDTGEAGDFRYTYALLRGASNDLATLTPVIWGGATPDPANKDNGVGVTLWDFEANRAFEEANDPNFDPTAGDRGRFAALFGAGPDEDDPEARLTFVVAVFRDFVPADNAGEAPIDLDYLYGRYESQTHSLDFIDFETQVDVDEPADGIREDLGIRMAFYDEGTGRAEADAANGSLAVNQVATGIECWDTSINRTYLQFDISETGSMMETYTEGSAENCGEFNATLSDLEIPSLQDIDPELLAALDDVATNGVPTE